MRGECAQSSLGRRIGPYLIGITIAKLRYTGS